MFTREIAIILAGALSLGTASAQSTDGESAPRMSADLPAILPETGERAPAPVPQSSAEDVEDIDIAAKAFGIGHTASASQIAEVDIDVMPAGSSNLEGRGTASEGKDVYETLCAACHGENLEGISDIGAPKLIGGRDSLASGAPVKTVESYWPYASTLVDYVYRAMPMNAPGSLTPDEAYAVSAYILGRAGIVDETFELSPETLDQVSMPNADGFTADPRPDVE